MQNWSLDLPNDFADYEWEVEAKGWFEARLTAEGLKYQLRFYDPARLRQQIDDELGRERAFFEPNLIIVQFVTRANMEHAVRRLVESGQLVNFVSE